MGVARSKALIAFGICALLACDTPHTLVIVDNAYAPSTTNVIYRAFWLDVSVATPIVPGDSSDPTPSVFASPNTAYVLLAPGWDPASTTAPTSFVVLESQNGFELDVNETLNIVVDDASFAGNCVANSTLTQDEADFITQRVFAQTFIGLHYDASTCTTTSAP